MIILNNCTVFSRRRCNYWGNDYFGLRPRTWIISALFQNQDIFFCIEQKCSLRSCYYYDVYVFKLSWQQNSMKCSQADSCIQIWRLADVSGTESDCIPIFTFEIRTEPVSERLECLHILTCLSAQERFIELQCFAVLNANTPSAANTVSFDLLPEAVKELFTFAKFISPLNSFPSGLGFRALLFAIDYQQRP